MHNSTAAARAMPAATMSALEKDIGERRSKYAEIS
jgi:hypothetical protein